jgi:hypothetical protein
MQFFRLASIRTDTPVTQVEALEAVTQVLPVTPAEQEALVQRAQQVQRARAGTLEPRVTPAAQARLAVRARVGLLVRRLLFFP